MVKQIHLFGNLTPTLGEDRFFDEISTRCFSSDFSIITLVLENGAYSLLKGFVLQGFYRSGFVSSSLILLTMSRLLATFIFYSDIRGNMVLHSVLLVGFVLQVFTVGFYCRFLL